MLVCDSYVIRMSLVCARMSIVYHSYVLIFTRMSFVCYSYVLSCHSHLLVCHAYLLLSHPYVTRIYSYVTRMYLYVIRMYSYVILMSHLCGFTMSTHSMFYHFIFRFLFPFLLSNNYFPFSLEEFSKLLNFCFYLTLKNTQSLVNHFTDVSRGVLPVNQNRIPNSYSKLLKNQKC